MNGSLILSITLFLSLLPAGRATAEMHPMLGKFLQRDPLRYEDGLNSQSYVRGNPVTQRDPTGKCTALCIASLYPDGLNCAFSRPPSPSHMGWNICICQGTPQFKVIPCVNESVISGFPAASRESVRKCATAHENTHFDDRGSKCVGGIVKSPVETENQDECEGYTEEVRCLREEMWNDPCKSNPECVKGVMMRLEKVHELKEHYCG